MSIELPAKAANWTNDHIDEALRRICDHERAIDKLKADYDASLVRIKTKFEDGKKEQKNAISALVKAIKAAGGKLRDKWVNKSLTLAWGMVAYRKKPRSLELMDDKTEEAAITWLEANGHGDCVRRDPVINKEVLERKTDDVIASAGYRWTEPHEVFDYKTRLTLEEEAKAKVKAGGA